MTETRALGIPANRGLVGTPPRIQSASPLARRVARRAANQGRLGLVPALRCECAQTICRNTWPAVAETHRGDAGNFIVVPAHFDGGVVVRAADQFFVIDVHRHATRALAESTLMTRFAVA